MASQNTANSTSTTSPSPNPASTKIIHISNYRQKNSSDDVKTALVEFFSFCGGIKTINILKEPSKDDYYSATIEFHDAASAQVAALMDHAVVGHPDEQISVKLIDAPATLPCDAPPVEPTPEHDEAATYMTPAGIIQKLIDLGFKLKDGTLELAQQINTTIRTQPVSQTLKQVGDAVLTTGQVALDVTQQAIHSTSDATVGAWKTVSEATQHSLSTAGEITAGLIKSTGEALPQEVKAVGSAVGTAVATTGHVLYDVSGNVLHNAGQATVDTLKVVGSTVSTTGQVVYDVSGNALHNASAATSELLKSASSTVVTTSTVALDVTGQKLYQVSNATVEATQIAAATVASVYEANKKPLLDAAQATVGVFSNIIGNLHTSNNNNNNDCPPSTTTSQK